MGGDAGHFVSIGIAQGGDELVGTGLERIVELTLALGDDGAAGLLQEIDRQSRRDRARRARQSRAQRQAGGELSEVGQRRGVHGVEMVA